jgi:hypothetical protein
MFREQLIDMTPSYPPMETVEGNPYATRFPTAATTRPKYDETQHGGIQTLPDDGLRSEPHPTAGEGAQRQRWRKRWITGAVVVMVVVVVGAVVGGAVGGTARKAKTNPAPVSAVAQSSATATATSPFTSATSLPSVYLGCYFDDGNRALGETYSTDSFMTPQVCNSICQGFPFYAVEYSS